MPAPLHLVPDRLTPIKAYSPKPTNGVKLDANEAPGGLPASFTEAFAARLATTPLHRYPDARAGGLRDALASHYKDSPDAFLIGCGSDEIIALLYVGLCRTSDTRVRPAVLYPTPSFVMYRINAITHGWTPIACPLTDGWGLDVAAMSDAIREHQPNLLFLATPNNPSGNTFSEHDIRAVVEAAPQTLCIIDEAYAPFCGQDLTRLRHDYPHVAIMRTLSKVGLAALRVGWLQAHPDLVQQLEKVRQPFNVSTLAQVAAELALTEHWPVFHAQIELIIRERERVRTALSAARGIRIYPSDANFLLAHFTDGLGDALGRLTNADITVRAFPEEPRLCDHLRMTIGTVEQNDSLIHALIR